MRPTAPIALASLLLGCASNPAPRPDAITAVTPAPEWNAVFERTEGWIGGDGAATVSFGDRVLWLFGDSGVGRVREGKYAPGSTLVNNAVAIHKRRTQWVEWGAPPEPESVLFAWGRDDAEGKPTALFVPPRPGEWYWPTGGGIDVYDAKPHQILFMSRLFRPRERDDGIWNFEGRGSDLLWIETPREDPRRWNPVVVATPGAVGPDLAPPRRKITWGTSVLPDGINSSSVLFIFGVDTTDPVNKKVILAKVDGRVVREMGAWRFWKAGVGDPWSAEVSDAAPLAEHVMDEFSVTAIPRKHGAPNECDYVLIHSEELLGRRVLARTAPAPAGPWGEPVVLYECPEPLADKRLMVYSAKAHPALSWNDELLVSYCVNSTDFWHMLSDASIYRPRFIRVPLSLLPEPPAR